MSTTMDMYLNITDSLSLPDMLDIDIKSETDIFMGGPNDLAGFNFSDLPPLELEETTDLRWISSCNSNSSFNLDDDDSTMVNPNTVMPLGSSMSLAQSIRSPTPTIKKKNETSLLKFTPANVKCDMLAKFKEQEVDEDEGDDEEEEEIEVVKKSSAVYPRILPKETPIYVKQTITKSVNNGRLVTFKNAVQQIVSPVSLNTVRTIQANRKQLTNSRVCHETERAFPKPAYSYSCLIAMALKNSRTGSLPVSEIYNFMCRHFPYFKTAPNGWKNSVRHNLSLNKCFAKIEKPAINGAQRKGCLWAMNPARITKMDEEVQKWSRKDPLAIRRAMLNPEHLELLERGELKFTYEDADGFGDSCGSAESGEGSDTEPENEVENTLNGESHFYGIGSVETEHEDDYDVDVTDSMYDNIDIEDDQDILRVEMALAQKELLEYERMVSNNKRRKIYVVQE